MYSFIHEECCTFHTAMYKILSIQSGGTFISKGSNCFSAFYVVTVALFRRILMINRFEYPVNSQLMRGKNVQICTRNLAGEYVRKFTRNPMKC